MRITRRARVGAFAVCCFAVFLLMVSYISPALAVGTDSPDVDSTEPLEVLEPSISFVDEPDSVSTQPTISLMAAFSSSAVRNAAVDYLAHISGSWTNFPGGAVSVDLIFNDTSASYAKLANVSGSDSCLLLYADSYTSSYPPFSVVVNDTSAYDLRYRVEAGVFQFSYRLSSSGGYTWSDYADFMIAPTSVVMPSSFSFPLDTPTTVFVCSLFIALVCLLRR